MSIENLETESIEIEAEIGLHDNCMKDRPGYRSGVRPNHWIPGREYCFIGEIRFKTNEWLKPGDEDIAIISCLIASQDKKLFQPGFAWHITEAGKIVGYGKCIRLLKSN